MYKVNYKNIYRLRKQAIKIFVSAIIFTLVLMGIFISSVVKNNKLNGEVLSYKVDLNLKGDMYSPIYYYNVDGKEYTCRSSYSSNIKPSSENEIIKYDLNNPEDCLSPYSKTGGVIILFLAMVPLVFIVGGYKQLKSINLRIKDIKYLEEHGKLIKNIPCELRLKRVKARRYYYSPIINYKKNINW